jgi:2-polyprenyl-6-methoxyphenol hydroxylase-like FAD-dependent oxidoreductase
MATKAAIVHFDAQAHGTPALAWIVDVQALQERLADACATSHWWNGWTRPSPPPSPSSAKAGPASPGPSTGVQFEVTPYDQRAIAARLHCEKPHDHLARQWFAEGEILAFLPLGGSDPGASGNSVAVVWSVHEQRAPNLLALDNAAFEASLEAASHHTLGKLTLASERAAWPLQLAQADRWCGPGWVLAGDAPTRCIPWRARA